jgi:kynurenine formamidase
MTDDRDPSADPPGPADEIGRLAWMTAESRREAFARADLGRPFDLAVTYRLGMPNWVEAGDPKYEIWMTHTPAGSVVDNLSGAGSETHERYSYAGSAISMYSHSGTHLCGLNHIGRDGVFWNGWTAERNLGSRAWNVGGVVPPIVARGLLLDIAALHGVECLPDSHAIDVTDLRGAAAAAGVEPRRGDAIFLRTGRMTRWHDPNAFLASPPGLGMEAARALCEEHGAMCIGLDVGGEVLPPEEPGTFLPVHAYLLSEAGAPLFENLWLEDLARAEITEFALHAAPLKLAGSTGMPVRPLAYPLVD